MLKISAWYISAPPSNLIEEDQEQGVQTIKNKIINSYPPPDIRIRGTIHTYVSPSEAERYMDSVYASEVPYPWWSYEYNKDGNSSEAIVYGPYDEDKLYEFITFLRMWEKQDEYEILEKETEGEVDLLKMTPQEQEEHLKKKWDDAFTKKYFGKTQNGWLMKWE